MLSTNQVLLNVVIPLWLVQETDAPRVLLAWLFGTNTVMAVLLQVAASRGVDTVPSGRCAPPGSAPGFFVLSCVIVLVTHDTIGWVTIALVWLGHVTVTGAELFQSAAHWGFRSPSCPTPTDAASTRAPPSSAGPSARSGRPRRTPSSRSSWGTPGWLLIAAIVVLATLGIDPAARAAERFLQADHSPRPGPSHAPA